MKGKHIPKRATTGSAGYDFYSPEAVDLKPGEWVTIDTGVSFEDSDVCMDFEKWFMMIVPRSGLSTKYGLRIRNTVAIIDMDYRDTIKLSITTEVPYSLQEGERFAQGIILPFGVFGAENVPTEQRKGGFGSTGKVE